VLGFWRGNPNIGADQLVLLAKGDAVVAEGDLVQQSDGSVVICVAAGGRLPNTGTPPACSSIAVAVVGLETDSVPTWTRVGSGGFAEAVRIFGTWTGTAVKFDHASTELSAQINASPCPPDSMSSGPPLDMETAVVRVNEIMRADPASYGGAWVAVDRDSINTLVVGVLGEPSAVTAALRTAYPFNLCITRVNRSVDDLQGLATKIRNDHPEWSPALDLPSNSVRVRFPIISDEIADVVRPYGGGVTVDALVRRQ
jgi:hypothetical protein